METFEYLQQAAKDNVDTTLKSVGALSNGTQAVAAEVVEFSKSAFQDGAGVLEKLLGARSIDKVVEVQTEYAKVAYENFASKLFRVSELYADLAKETYEPFATIMSAK